MRLPGLSGRVPKPTESAVGRKSAATPKSLVGSVFLNRYKVLRFLGEGSNAHVYLAQNIEKPDRLVVVKRIKDHVHQNPRFRQFFDNEVLSMSKFVHPYAVRLFDASLSDPLGACMILDFIPGQTLESLLANYQRVSVERMVRLVGPLCHALQAAHNAGIVHRDLKPANMMVQGMGTDEETVRVMDFGFAGFVSKPHIQLAELTGTGPIFACGTPAYVSPEMVRGDAVDARGDLYSVGVIMFEMLTGRLPFECQTQEELLAAHIQEPPPRFHRIGFREIPASVEGVIQTALCKYPSERHASAKALIEQLSRAVGYDVWHETSPERNGPRPTTGTDDDVVICTLADDDVVQTPSPSDDFVLSDQFEAMLPERLAAAKLRGFIEDVHAVAVASEPGLIRVRLELPSGFREPTQQSPSKSGLMSWFNNLRMPSVAKGKEPIEMDLEMKKIDADRVKVQLTFRPLPYYLPDDKEYWNARCEGYYSILRRYLMAE